MPILLRESDVAGLLSHVVAGDVPGREHASQITRFKSLGIALEDMAVAALVYAKARERGIGDALGKQTI